MGNDPGVDFGNLKKVLSLKISHFIQEGKSQDISQHILSGVVIETGSTMIHIEYFPTCCNEFLCLHFIFHPIKRHRNTSRWNFDWKVSLVKIRFFGDYNRNSRLHSDALPKADFPPCAMRLVQRPLRARLPPRPRPRLPPETSGFGTAALGAATVFAAALAFAFALACGRSPVFASNLETFSAILSLLGLSFFSLGGAMLPLYIQHIFGIKKSKVVWKNHVSHIRRDLWNQTSSSCTKRVAFGHDGKVQKKGAWPKESPDIPLTRRLLTTSEQDRPMWLHVTTGSHRHFLRSTTTKTAIAKPIPLLKENNLKWFLSEGFRYITNLTPKQTGHS